jgi:hypothetical protein
VSELPQRAANGMGAQPGWAELEPALPQIAATMRRYLTQTGCVLRPGSVGGADLALRSFAAFLIGAAPEVTSLTAATRRHIEDYKPWLAARPGQNKPALTTATIAHRLGTLRMIFVRLEEWGWDQAPPRVPMFPGDLPRQDHPLPNAPGDGAAAKLLRAAQNDRRLLVRVTVETLLNPHDGITLDQKGYDRWRLFYMNGRKRTHAMLEAGVHRTVVIRWRAPRRH